MPTRAGKRRQKPTVGTIGGGGRGDEVKGYLSCVCVGGWLIERARERSLKCKFGGCRVSGGGGGLAHPSVQEKKKERQKERQKEETEEGGNKQTNK